MTPAQETNFELSLNHAHNMHDPNPTRSHYRRTSERLAREKRLRQTFTGFCLTTGAVLLAVIIALLHS